MKISPKFLTFNGQARVEFVNNLANELKGIQSRGTFKRERIILGAQNVEIQVKGSSQKLLNFCANNYLGLSNHPEVVKAAKQALETYGAGLSSVRFICGTQDIHKQLEKKIAEFHGREDAIIYGSCFDANGGIFEALFGQQDMIISDQLNHASIIDGMRLSKSTRSTYRHCDMADLDEKLSSAKSKRHRLIVTDGVFSMDGDIAPLKEICSLAQKHQSLVMIDECHATGFFGKTGRGTEEYAGVMGNVDIINSTLGKALGGAMGGYTTSSKEVVELLRQVSRPYLFSNSLAPPVAAAALKSLDLIMTDPTIHQSLQSKVARFRTKMEKAGFTVLGSSEHPICPVMFEDASLASQFADEILKEGIYVISFSFPVVAKDRARIRVQISAAHKDAHIDRCVEAFEKVAKKLKVPLDKIKENHRKT